MVRFIIFAILLALLSAHPGHGASVASVTSEPKSITTVAQTSKSEVAATPTPMKQEVATTAPPKPQVTTQIPTQVPTNSTQGIPDPTPTSKPAILITNGPNPDPKKPCTSTINPLVPNFFWPEHSVVDGKPGLVCMQPSQFMLSVMDKFPRNFQMPKIVGEPKSLFLTPSGSNGFPILVVQFKNSTGEVTEIQISAKWGKPTIKIDDDKETAVQDPHKGSGSDNVHTGSGPVIRYLEAELEVHHLSSDHIDGHHTASGLGIR